MLAHDVGVPTPPLLYDSSAVTDSLGLPAVFGRYLLLRRLSSGGMGEIFLAKVGELQGMEKLCIIKKILPQLAEDQGFIRRFVDEAQIAIKLSHAAIASVYEVGMVGGEYFLAMEYVAGRDLRRLLARIHELGRKLSPDLSLYIIREVASALAYAHRRTDEHDKALGIVHCDVSPPNVLLSFDGEVKLIDFGIAKSRQQLSITDPNVGFGKFGYMAPEQLVRGRRVDRRTDIYAAGVILYELLVGDRMLAHAEGDGSDYRLLVRRIAAGKIDRPSQRDASISGDLDELVMHAIAADPKDRYQVAEELRDVVQRRLYALNPSISSDQLARVIRELFGAEEKEDQILLAQARALDLAPFREEMHGGRTHTVSFALAAPFDVPPGREADTAMHTQVVRHARRPVNARLAAGAALAILLLGAGLFVRRRHGAAPRLAALPQGASAPASAAPLPAPLPPTLPSPPAQATALETPAPAPASLPPPRTLKPGGPRAVGARSRGGARPTRTLAAAAGPPAAPPPAAPSPPPASPAQIEAKYRAVHREYEDFKRAFGSRLEPDWHRILEQYTFGQGGERYQRVDTMLDDLRREMTRIRGGG
jgi:serine/threonine-protein kinase